MSADPRPKFSARVAQIMERQAKEKEKRLLALDMTEAFAPLPGQPPEVALVPGGGPLSYSHAAMLEVIIANPTWTHKQYGQAFGKNAGWFAAVLASESFQRAMDSCREAIVDPSITATMDERLRALAMRGLQVLQEKLDSPLVSDLIVMKAAEIGIKGLGLGQAVPVESSAPVMIGAEAVADRIMLAMASAKSRTNALAVDAVVKVKGV